MFLDDIGRNLKPARALGMTTIKVDDPVQALGEMFVVLLRSGAEREAARAIVLRLRGTFAGVDTSDKTLLSALDLVVAHLRVHAAARDVIDCIDALKRDVVAERIAARLAAPREGDATV